MDDAVWVVGEAFKTNRDARDHGYRDAMRPEVRALGVHAVTFGLPQMEPRWQSECQSCNTVEDK
jgi:hypothetical protein